VDMMSEKNLDVEMAEQIILLNEENKVLKRALELACQEIKRNESGCCGGLFYIQKIKADYGIDQMTYFDIFIKLAEQELEKEQKDVKD
jgi:hypothetical protein